MTHNRAGSCDPRMRRVRAGCVEATARTVTPCERKRRVAVKSLLNGFNRSAASKTALLAGTVGHLPAGGRQGNSRSSGPVLGRTGCPCEMMLSALPVEALDVRGS